RREKLVTWRLLPATFARRGGGRRHLPVRLEGAKMIDAQEIESLELVLEPPHPPIEPRTLVRGPIVQRVAPELTVLVEIVGRHAGDRRGPAAIVDLEELGLPPGFDAVEVHVERQIPEKAHPARVRVPLERRPREVEQLLLERD